MTRFLFSALLLCGVVSGQELPIAGLAHVGFLTSDLAKARKFYSGVLGYEGTFDLKDDKGETTLIYFKINDDQYIEVFPGLKPDQDWRMTHVAMVTPDIEKLHRMLGERGLDPPKINRGRDGNLNFSIKDPDGMRLEFVQYLSGSLHTQFKGKLMPDARVSRRLMHAGIPAKSEAVAMSFYRDKLGFKETWRGGPTEGETRWINMKMPGGRGDYVELMLYSAPPNRSQLGSMLHICLDVSDIQAAHKALLARGLPDEDRHKPRLGRNKRWLLNLFDPDGSRTEVMEPAPR